MKVTASSRVFVLLVTSLVVSCDAATKPNILMIVIDDLGWSDTSYKGSDISTPTIDKLANEGIRLQQYYVQSLCSPSRAALMVGRYPYYMGLAHTVISNGFPFGMPLNQTTIADELKKGGYSTHCVGKWDLGMHKWEYTPTYRGFDTFYGYYDAVEDYFTHITGVAPIINATFDLDSPLFFNGIDFRNNTTPVMDKKGQYSTTLFTEAIEDIITSHDSNKGPFFIYAAYQSVHAPLEAPQKYIDQCQDIPYDNRHTFCGMLKAADEGIANITRRLQETNLLDNTIILFTTDNGGQTHQGSRNWPLRGNKATVFEGGVRGTAFVWGSKLLNQSYDNHQLIHVTDWLPTIVEGIAGLELDKDKWTLDGYNVWPTITTNSKTPCKEVLINLDPPMKKFIGQAAIRVGDYKLIRGQPNCSMESKRNTYELNCPSGWVHTNGTIEPPPPNPSLIWLFNVIIDPTERHNLAEDHPDIVGQLTQMLEEHSATPVKQLSPKLDLRSDPALHHGIWTPWIH